MRSDDSVNEMPWRGRTGCLSPVRKVKRIGCWSSRSQTLFGNALRETPFRVSRADSGRQTRNRVSRKSVPKQSLGTSKGKHAFLWSHAIGESPILQNGARSLRHAHVIANGLAVSLAG